MQGYDFKKVHRFSYLAICIIGIFFSLKTIIFDRSFEDVIYTIVVVAVASIVYFLPINDLVKGFLFAFVPATIAIALIHLDGGGFSLINHYIIVVSIAIIAMYFEAKLIVIFGVYINVMYILSFILAPADFTGGLGLSADFLSIMLMINGAMALLYALNRMGKKMVNEALASRQEVRTVMTALTSTMDQVDQSAHVLTEHTATMMVNASETLKSSRQVATAMEEITIGVQDQAESVTEINMQVSAISKDVGEAQNISELLTDSNTSMMVGVSEGQEEVDHMSSQMKIIDSSISAAIVTVEELKDSMDEIGDFLTVITNISSQTNLLALNASIESARAGEAGKGFAVVADEIRKLAELSAASVKDINKIVESIGGKSKEAVLIVGKGNVAVEEGTGIIDRITNRYTNIKDSFVENNEALKREIEMIEQINQSFAVVHDRISNIASISEEQSASSQEILATIANQESDISGLTHSVEEIKALSTSLAELIVSNGQK